MNLKRMAELSGVPGLVESLSESETEIDIERFPEVIKVTGFAPEWPGSDVERTLSNLPLPAMTSNIDRAAFRLSNLGVLTLDAQGAAWHIYLTPRASDGQIDTAIEMARRALILAIERSKADWLSNYRRQESLDEADKADGEKVKKALIAAFEKGGYDKMMIAAYRIELRQTKIQDGRQWLIGVMQDIYRGTVPEIKLSKNEMTRTMMYRDKLREQFA